MPRSTPTIPRDTAARLIYLQLGEGQRLLGLPVDDRVGLASMSQAKAAWSLRNRQFLFKLFEDHSGIEGYRLMQPLTTRASLPLQAEHLRQELRGQLACLQGVLERLRPA